MTCRHRSVAVTVPIGVALTFIIRAKLPSNHPMQKATSPAMQIMYSISLSAIFCPWKSISGNIAQQKSAGPKLPPYMQCYTLYAPFRDDVSDMPGVDVSRNIARTLVRISLRLQDYWSSVRD